MEEVNAAQPLLSVVRACWKEIATGAAIGAPLGWFVGEALK